MKKTLLPILLAAALPLGGCAYGLGGDVLGGVLGDVMGDRGAYGRGGPDLQDMAVDACGREASRYGRVAIADVRRASSSTLRVTGTVDVNNYQRRSFGCSYREDGRITDFDIR